MDKEYSKTIGYAPLTPADNDKLLRGIRVNKKIIDEYLLTKNNDRILVAGAGLGYEASLIRNEFQRATFGVDLYIDINHSDIDSNYDDLFLQRQDLHSLAFSKDAFSLIYCYHVLEHVSDHLKVLNEFYRVLKPGGILFIGFPNKNRILSYIGTYQKVPVLKKIKWNINDYFYKLQGKFENKYGAHAGFTEKEFMLDASVIFEQVIPVRNKYMVGKYPKLSTIIALMIRTRIEEIVFPSNYFICIKKSSHE